jgi:hypothetical protein
LAKPFWKPLDVLRDKVRSMLRIRVDRKSPPIGAKPQPGRAIVRGRNRMIITTPVPDDLWYYLTLLGWREVPVARDRRRYVDLPSASLELLMRAPRSRREARYRQLLDQATRIAEARARGRARL